MLTNPGEQVKHFAPAAGGVRVGGEGRTERARKQEAQNKKRVSAPEETGFIVSALHTGALTTIIFSLYTRFKQ